MSGHHHHPCYYNYNSATPSTDYSVYQCYPPGITYVNASCAPNAVVPTCSSPCYDRPELWYPSSMENQFGTFHPEPHGRISMPTSMPAETLSLSVPSSRPVTPYKLEVNKQYSPQLDITHPYARLLAKKEEKRRKIWNHALEKSLFSPFELSTLRAPHRRKIYISSLEAHIDQLHAQLLSLGLSPVPTHELDALKGLNSKTAKGIVAGLQHDASTARLKLLELERSNNGLRAALDGQGSAQFENEPPHTKTLGR